MIKLNTQEMRRRLNESYGFIYAIEAQQKVQEKDVKENGAKDTQVGNG